LCNLLTQTRFGKWDLAAQQALAKRSRLPQWKANGLTKNGNTLPGRGGGRERVRLARDVPRPRLGNWQASVCRCNQDHCRAWARAQSQNSGLFGQIPPDSLWYCHPLASVVVVVGESDAAV